MKSKLLIIALVVIAAALFNYHYPVKDSLQGAVEWFRALGPWAILPYMIVFVLAGMFFIPISGMILMAGTLYGFWLGYLLASVSAMLAVGVTYGLGRKLWRRRVEDLRKGHPRFESVLEAVSKHGPILVFLIRLNPFLPFSVLNYLFTIPKMDVRKYLLSSFLAMTPDIFFYLYVGHVGQGLLEDSSHVSGWSWFILGTALLTTIAAGVIINRVIRKSLPQPARPIAAPSPSTSRS